MTTNPDFRRKSNIESVHRLLGVQPGLLTQALQAGSDDPYYSQYVFELEGALSIDAFDGAWRDVVARHEILRADFRWEGLAQPAMIVYRETDAACECDDWRGLSEADQHARLAQAWDARRAEGFHLARAASLQLQLIRVAEQRFWFVWRMHHVQLDGWSLPIVLREVMARYAARSAGPGEPLAPAPGLKVYRSWLDAQDRDAAEARWCAALAGLDVPTPLPASTAQSDARRRYAELRLRLDPAASAALVEFARTQRVTLGSVVQAAWAFLLARRADREEAVFGVTAAGRPAEIDGMDAMVGVFINTVPMPVRLSASQSVGDWVRAQQARSFALRAVEHVPLARIQAVANGGRALFESIVVIENYPVDSSGARAGDLQVRMLGAADIHEPGMRYTDGRNPYALSLIVAPGAQFEYVLAYDTRRFTHAAIEVIGAQLRDVLAAFAAQPERALGELGLRAQAAANGDAANGDAVNDAQSAPRASAPYAPLAAGDTLLARIAQIVRTRPDAQALADGAQSLDWRAVWNASGRLAQRLVDAGVKRESRVALVLPRGVEFVLGVLAVWRAGGAYVPLDIAAPAGRLAWQVSDSHAQCAIARDDADAWLPSGTTRIDPADALAVSDDNAASNLDIALPLPGQLAYLIYTSGSTGRPKGVMIAHDALSAYLDALLTRVPDGIERAACLSTPAADLGHTTLFGALWAGWTLHMPAEALSFDPDACGDYLRRHRIDILKIVPSHLGGLLQAAQPEQVLPARCLVLGGEAASGALIERIATLAPHCVVLNHYGPTETTVGALTWRKPAADLASLPLGYPLPHANVQLLDAHGNPAGDAAYGEICIGGASVARGYAGRPGLTAERFVPDPSGHGARVYRTGDRGRIDEQGRFVFLGRRDDQVKIRGYRVEPEEVGACLRALPGVRDGIVIAREDDAGRVQLHAFASGIDLRADVLRAALAQTLPDALVPDTFTVLDVLPLTANGKIDRRALTPMEAGVGADARAVVAPRTDAQKTLLAIWQAALGREDIGVTDNFFEIGGDSILSLRIIAKARQAGLGLTPKQVFDHPTIEAAAAVARPVTPKAPRASGAASASASGSGAAVNASNAAANALANLPLTPIQARFFAEHPGGPNHWNQSMLLAANERLSLDALRTAVQTVMSSHDALRLRFTREGNNGNVDAAATGRWTQRCAASETGTVDYVDLREASDWQAAMSTRGAQIQASLDLAQGPVWRAVLFDVPGGQSRLLLVVHHLSIDGVSWRVLLEDLGDAYEQALAGRPITLPAPGLSWGEWTAALSAHAQRDAVRSEITYWRTQWSNTANWDDATRAAGGLPLTARLDDIDSTLGASRTILRRLDAARTRALLQDVPGAYRTRIDEVLLAALVDTLARWSKTRGVLVELEGHGREDVIDGVDLTRTVGWFTTRYPVWFEATHDDGVQTLAAVKTALRGVPNKGLHYGVLEYLGGAAERAAIAALPRAQVSFNYLGQFGQSDDADRGRMRIAADEHAGRAASPLERCGHALAFNAWIVDGALSIEWRHVPGALTPAVADALATAFDTHLRALIDHCASAPRAATSADFPLSGLDEAGLRALALPLDKVDDIYPATPLQQGLIFHAQLRQGSGTYVNQLRLTLNGALDAECLADAWRATLARHDVLRTAFRYRGDGELLQVVYRHAELPVAFHAWHGEHNGVRYDDRLHAWCAEDLAQGVEIESAPLMRVNVFARPDGAHDLIWTSHHALTDGWSSSRLLDEVGAHYAAAKRGETARLAPPGRYRDYVAWLGAQGSEEAAQAVWRERFDGFDDPVMLEAAFGRTAQPRQGLFHVEQRVSAEVEQALRAAAQRAQVTLNTLIQGGWALLLARYGGRDAVMFGVTTSGRSAGNERVPGIDAMLGLFINSLPLGVRVPADRAAADWLRDLQRANAELREHEHVSLAQVQRWLGRGGSALFDTLLVFENYDTGERREDGVAEAGGLTVSAAAAVNRTHYPLTLSVTPGQALSFEWAWDGEHLDRATIGRLAADYLDLLTQLAEAASVANATMVGAIGVRHQAHHATSGDASTNGFAPAHVNSDANGDANKPPFAIEPAGALPARVAQIASLDGARIAIACGDKQLDYRTLVARSQALARNLLLAGVQREARVGVCVARSEQLPLALLGVLTSGACYVPLDPDYPASRLQLMIEDAGIQSVVTDAVTRARFADPGSLFDGLKLIDVETASREADDVSDVSDVGGTAAPDLPALLADQLAYVIYTSGSTGRPKGVAISHGALDRFLQSMTRAPGLTRDDILLSVTSPSFDIFALEAYAPLLLGARVEIATRADVVDGERLAARLVQTGASVMQATPSGWKLLLATGWQASAGFRALCGGEALAHDLAVALRARGVTLWNMYGPTETTVWSSVARIDGTAPITLGAPIDHTVLRVLDTHGHQVPRGGAGELYIGGENLARGYLGRAALTAERFVPDPFGKPGARLYRTGDACRVDMDDQLRYLGRLDQQVKLRGHRIEIGEIEAVLRAQPGVRDAAVVLLDGDGQAARLAGALVPADGAGLALDALQQAVSAALPSHMVPTVWRVCQALPQTPNGKLDRRALADACAAEAAPAAALRTPRTPLEATLVDTWQRVLGQRAIGIDDDFFQLGGDSLAAMRVMAQLRAAGVGACSLEMLFVQRTPAALAAAIEEGAADWPGNLVALNAAPKTAATTLFCIHPGFGLVNGYAPLAAALPCDVRAIGVQSPRYTDAHWQPADFAAWIADYVARIRAAQPHGPYRLLGWSLGGLLAAHIAQALERAGETVAWLGVLDTDPDPAPVDCNASVLDLDTLRDYLAPRSPQRAAALDTLHATGDDPAALLDSARAAGLIDADEQATLLSLVEVVRLQRRLLTSRRAAHVRADIDVWHVSGNDAARRDATAWRVMTSGVAHTVAAPATTHAAIVHHPSVLDAVGARLRAGSATVGDIDSVDNGRPQ
ncbi:non-ribosomal peptide synthetase [Paraburkholderia sp. WP4_3_2]|nr:non-ribosomal peptide synthetase [Paraburkholderia sp. WP4_3_2]